MSGCGHIQFKSGRVNSIHHIYVLACLFKDIRDQSCRQTFHARTSYSSPVRDVVYCPHESHTLAGAFENGLVCIWDTRFDSRPARSFQAHNAVTASIDWHPNWNSVE